MVRIEQIQSLEDKIDKAVELINISKKRNLLLSEENLALKTTIQHLQEKLGELENLLEQFKGEQNRIEEGIINALSKLDNLEDEISEESDSPGDEPMDRDEIEEPAESEPEDPVEDNSGIVDQEESYSGENSEEPEESEFSSNVSGVKIVEESVSDTPESGETEDNKIFDETDNSADESTSEKDEELDIF